MNHITGVLTIGVPVTDQDRAVQFYTETLGFALLMDAPLPQFGGRWIVVAPPGADVSLALVPAGLPSEAEAAHKHFIAAGVDTDELLLWPSVPPMFSLRDQDGNRLYLTQV
jgi:catechol 2,3-dioxygenase-like lactoylglutathione lyase family enzyme